MESFQIDQILQDHPKGRLDFSYCPGRYALMLLNWAAGEGKRVRELKESRFGQLLSKPIVRRAVARTGAEIRPGSLERAAFDAHVVEPIEMESYQLTFGRWGLKNHECWEPRWDQTTRPGQNLVLQLNFTRRHNRAYYAMLDPTDEHLFLLDCHPNSEHSLTLAWARIDLALENGEALIEEIQSDWVSCADWFAEHLKYRHAWVAGHRNCQWMRQAFSEKTTADDVRLYFDTVLRPYSKTWSEAMLSAALWFIRDWVGIRRIFFNTFETGNWLKDLQTERLPPRWIYTTLPKRFCFEETDARPRALARSKNHLVRARLKKPGLRWFLLEL